MTAALTFGRWLKSRRRGLGLTQKELARQVGYAEVTLRKVEADELRPSRQMVQRLAEALQLTSEEQAQFVRFARDEAQGETGLHNDVPPALPLPKQQPHHEDRAPTPALPTRPRNNLPAQTTPLIGREHELADLAQWLSDSATRLVTILSPGGTGKTHLALAAAQQQVEHFAHGVCWVALAPLTDASELVAAISAALALPLQGGTTPERQLGDFLRAKHLLLVLDNFEHLLTGAPLVGEFLAQAPHLSILVTSRQRLKLSSETVLSLDGLTFPPDTSAGALDYPAVQLFLLHARRLRPRYQPDDEDLAGTAAVCRLVQGMPLGILLAAAWSRLLAPAEIAAEIRRDPNFLHADMQDIPARQRNLRALFLYTWSRLANAEQEIFMRLSVFRGGTNAEAARQVTGATVEVLAGLVDQALLRRLPNGRYDIHELLRQFAAEQLAAATAHEASIERAAHAQHSRYYLNLLGEQEQRLQGPEQRIALGAIRADFENIGAAWRWAVQAHAFDLLTPAVHALFLYCEIRGNFGDGVVLFGVAADELEAAVAGDTASQPELRPLRGRLRVRLGACTFMIGNCEGGEHLLGAGLQLVTEDWERALTLLYLGIAAGERGDVTRTRDLCSSGLAISRQNNDLAGMADALHRLSFANSDFVENNRLCSESLALWRKLGRQDKIATALNELGANSWFIGDYGLAEACWRESLALCDQLDLRNEKAWAQDWIGFAAWCRGEMEAAERCIQNALAIYTELGRQASMGMCMVELALVLANTDRGEPAKALAQQGVALTRRADSQQMLAYSLDCLGAVLLIAGDRMGARSALLEAVQCAWKGGYLFFLMTAFYYFAELLELESHHVGPTEAQAQRYLAVALLGCVRSHKATWAVFRDKAERLIDKIGSALSPEARAAAYHDSESRTVDAMVTIVMEGKLDLLTGPPPHSAQPPLTLRVPVQTSPSFNGDSPTDWPPRDETIIRPALTPTAQHDGLPVEPLTLREFGVLRLIAAGRSNHDIAAQLVLAPGTVKWYISEIFGKLGVHSRTQAVARARELGLLR